MQTNDYYRIELLITDSKTWNHLTICILFVLRIETWSYNCLEIWFGLFYGISNFVGYLMPTTEYKYIIHDL